MSLIRNLSTVCRRLVAVRTNSFFHPGSYSAITGDCLNALKRGIARSSPDLIFSVNRAGLSPEILRLLPAHTKIISLFIDYHGRFADELKQFNNRDFIWGTGIGQIRDTFLEKYKHVLSEDRVEFTLWCSDTAIFKPLNVNRDIDLGFVGTAFPTRGLSEFLDQACNNSRNREVMVQLYLDHRSQYIDDLTGELLRRGFDLKAVPPAIQALVMDNARMQILFSDHLSAYNRIKYLAALSDMNLHIYGEPRSTWLELICAVNPDLLQCFKFASIRGDEELCNLYSRSKISINVQHDHCRDDGLSFRVFDSIACESMLMTQDSARRPLGVLGMIENEDYLCFSTPADLHDKCHYYLQDEDSRLAIASSARKKLLATHTLRHRLANIFSKAGMAAVSAKVQALTDMDVVDNACKDRISFFDTFPLDESKGSNFDWNGGAETELLTDSAELLVQFRGYRLRFSPEKLLANTSNGQNSEKSDCKPAGTGILQRLTKATLKLLLPFVMQLGRGLGCNIRITKV